jgi:transglutaminase-like putative cysteine protease
MRFGVLHRIVLDSLATVGLLALVATGEFDRKAAISLLLGLSLALSLPSTLRELRLVQITGSLLPVAFLCLQMFRLTSSANVVTLAVEFAALLQVVRLATRRGAAHDQQIVLLALLHLIAATVLGAGLTYAACFIGFMFLAPVTLLLSHLRREVEGNYRQGARDRAGLPVDVPRILRSRRVVSPAYLGLVVCLSLPMFVFTGVLFVVFPRVGLSLLLLQPPRKARLVGFSDRVDLGVVGKLHSDPSVALRLTYPELPAQPPEHLAVYLRGAALDYYDGKAWSKTQTSLRTAEHEGNYYPFRKWLNPAVDRFMTVELSPIEPPIVFLPSDVAAIQLLPQVRAETPETVGIFRNSDDEFRYIADGTTGLRYRVFFNKNPAPWGITLPPEERAKYLALPPGISNRVAQLAKTWVGEENDRLAQSRLVEQHLRREYRYDLESPSGAAINPVEDFLFSSHRGHCEYYATAMAILLRTLGIPARNVTGFGAATFNRFGRFYVVRQSDAHSWVEAWVDDVGWHRFDPTPPQAPIATNELVGFGRVLRDLIEAAAQRWSQHVEAYDIQQQLRLAGQIRSRAEALGLAAWPRRWATARTILPIVLAIFLGFGLVRFWRNRKYRSGKSESASPRTLLSPPAKLAIQLYQGLEKVFVELGIPRPEGTPPWGYAITLSRIGHPVADQVTELTKLYLEARFGERQLLPSEVDKFQRTLDELRQSRLCAHAA